MLTFRTDEGEIAKPLDASSLRESVEKGELPVDTRWFDTERGGFAALDELPDLSDELRDWLKEQIVKRQINQGLHHLNNMSHKEDHVVDSQGFLHSGKLSLSVLSLADYYAAHYKKTGQLPPVERVSVKQGWRGDVWSFRPEDVQEIRHVVIILRREGCDGRVERFNWSKDLQTRV